MSFRSCKIKMYAVTCINCLILLDYLQEADLHWMRYVMILHTIFAPRRKTTALKKVLLNICMQEKDCNSKVKTSVLY